MVCTKCGGESKYNSLDGICNKCAKKEYFRIILPIAFILFIGLSYIGFYFGDMDFNYEKDKCSNMETLNYEFTNDIQINVEYTEKCYHLMNHPFAYFSHISFGFIFGLILLVFSPMYILWRSL